ncbi:hypothetical protein ACHAXH_000019, partial [Discostella pseudostelligera]
MHKSHTMRVAATRMKLA